MGFFLQHSDPRIRVRDQKSGRSEAVISPSLVVLPFSMRSQIALAFEPFCTFDAIVLAKTWKIFCSFGGLILGEMFHRGDVGFDLVQVSAGAGGR